MQNYSKWTSYAYNEVGFNFISELVDLLKDLKNGNTATIPFYKTRDTRIVVCLDLQVNYDWDPLDEEITIRLSNDVRRCLLRTLTPESIATIIENIGLVKQIVTIS